MDSHYKGAQKLGHGIGYQYAHNYKNHYAKQQYLPDELVGSSFYRPGDSVETLVNIDRLYNS